MKLSPNVTDIQEIARAAEEGGADGISLINTPNGECASISIAENQSSPIKKVASQALQSSRLH